LPAMFSYILDPLSNVINSFLNNSYNILFFAISIFLSISVAAIIMVKLINMGFLDIFWNIHFRRIILPLILSLVLMSILSSNIFDTNITIEMNDVYNKQNEIIPIEIRVTGEQYHNIFVNLSEVDDQSELTPIDSIRMESNILGEVRFKNRIVSNKYLTCNNVEDGIFKVYINCTNITKGYYELSFTTGNSNIFGSSEKSKKKYFYLN
jgi:hypothetical protein